MSEPVTTNPFVIMLINMTVVFLVLIALGLVIRLIHVIDPTAKKEKKAEEAVPAAVVSEPEPVAPAVVEGVSPEIVAAIAAAVTVMSGGSLKVHAIRPQERNGWKQSGRIAY